MANYTVKLTVEAGRIDALQAKLKRMFPEASAYVDKVKRNPSRADRLSEAESYVEDAKSVVGELKGEMENWRDTLPENLQSSDKATQIDDAISNLEELESNLEQCDFSSIEFPQMMG